MSSGSFLDYFNKDLRAIRKQKLTYLTQGALYNIIRCIKEVEQAQVPGIMVETGCALGGSTILMGKTKRPARVLKVYDVFGMIPEPSERDGADVHERYEVIAGGSSSGIKGGKYYGYEDDLINKVRGNLRKFGLSEKDNIELIQGLYEDTLVVDEPVALAHIDCDWYDSVMTCLVRIEPQLSPGGILIIDDYHHYSGCKKAVDEYFNSRKSDYQMETKNNKLIIKSV